MVNYKEIAQLPPLRGGLHSGLVIPVQDDNIADLQQAKKMKLTQLADWLGLLEPDSSISNVLDIQQSEDNPRIYIVFYKDGSKLEIDTSCDRPDVPPEIYLVPSAITGYMDYCVEHVPPNVPWFLNLSGSGSSMLGQDGQPPALPFIAEKWNGEAWQYKQYIPTDLEIWKNHYNNTYWQWFKGAWIPFTYNFLPNTTTNHDSTGVTDGGKIVVKNIAALNMEGSSQINTSGSANMELGHRSQVIIIDGGKIAVKNIAALNMEGSSQINTSGSANMELGYGSQVRIKGGGSDYYSLDITESGVVEVKDGAKLSLTQSAKINFKSAVDLRGVGASAISGLQGIISTKNALEVGARVYILSDNMNIYNATSNVHENFKTGDIFYFCTIGATAEYTLQYSSGNSNVTKTIKENQAIALMLFNKDLQEDGSANLAFTYINNEDIDLSGLYDAIATESRARQDADQAIKAALDLNVETATGINTDEDSVKIKTTLTNIIDKTTTQSYSVIPTVTLSYAGVMDSAMFKRFGEMDDSITTILSQMTGQPRVAVVSGLGASPSQTDLTNAFTTALNSAPVAADRIICTDTQTEWIFNNSGDWVSVSAIPLNLATQTNDGIVTHSTEEGTVGYYVAGIGQVNGYSNLKAQVQALLNNQGSSGAASNRWAQFVQTPMDLDILTALGA